MRRHCTKVTAAVGPLNPSMLVGWLLPGLLLSRFALCRQHQMLSVRNLIPSVWGLQTKAQDTGKHYMYNWLCSCCASTTHMGGMPNRGNPPCVLVPPCSFNQGYLGLLSNRAFTSVVLYASAPTCCEWPKLCLSPTVSLALLVSSYSSGVAGGLLLSLFLFRLPHIELKL
jgi:hypothetical protein